MLNICVASLLSPLNSLLFLMSSAFSRVPSPAANNAACVDAALAAFARQRPPLPLGVAYSGGADSTALLLDCARL